MGRQKIEIKKIEKEEARLVSFSKRRAGIFSKASCLTTLCHIDVAIVVFSPAGTPHSFGSPTASQVIDRFLSNDRAPADLSDSHSTAAVQELSLQCMELEGRIAAARAKCKALEAQVLAAMDEHEQMKLEELLALNEYLGKLKEMCALRICS